jgi:hypothetical protein
MGLEEGGRKRVITIWHLVGLPSYKNLVEAVEVELARYWPEVQQVRRGEQVSDGAIDRPLPSVEDWRPPPDPSSEKAQETRRAERLDSYQQ